jgi:MFS family permease
MLADVIQVKADSLIRHPDFRRLWTGDAISQIGTMITMLALPLLAVKTLHATPFEVGLLTTFETVAFLLVGLPAGAWVDRMRKRSVMIAGDLGRAAALGSVPLVGAFGALTIWQLYAVVLLTGVLTVFFDVSYQSYLPFLIGREHLVEGNSKLQGTQSVAQVAGPSLGGLLVQLLTAPYAIALDAASYLWSALWVGSIRAREPRPERTAETHLMYEVREGVAFVVRHPLLRAIAGCTGSFNLFFTAAQAMLIVLLARNLHLPAGVIGLLLAAGAVGGLAGALLARRLADRFGQGPIIWRSCAFTTPLMLIAPFLQRDATLALFVVAEFVLYGGTVVYNVTQVSFRQALCPERLLGRMNATMRFLVWGTMPLGGLLGGALGDTIGVRMTILVSVIGTSLAFLPVYLSPLRTMRELPGHEAGQRVEVDLAASHEPGGAGQ